VTLRPVQPQGFRTLRASGDRWLFGYADVVTLLFACFAALYAAQVERPAEPPAAVAEVAPPVSTPVPVAEVAPAEPAVPPSTLARDVERLAASQDQIQIELVTGEGGTVISLAEAGSFPPGKADLSDAAARVIRQLAQLVAAQPFAVRVEGHTDDRPIRTSKYESNWELSTARAARVVQFLVEEGLPPGRLSAAGYGEFRPRMPNDTRASRARNRRVDIVVLDGAGVQDRPEKADYRIVGARPSDGR